MAFTVEPLSDPEPAHLIGDACWDLDDLLTRLANGTLGLWKVPPITLEIWWAGRCSRNTEVRELQDRLERVEQEADALYERLYNPGRTLSDIRSRRLQQALELADAQDRLATEVDVFRVATTAAPLRRTA